MWTLERGDDSRSFEEWGLSLPRKFKLNQGIGEATFTASGALADSEPVLAYDDRVKIKKDGVIWFQGRVVETPAEGDGPSESLSYRVVDTWFDLEDLAYQQRWGSAEYTSHVFLNINGLRQITTVRSMLQDVIAYAAGQGVSIQPGEILPEMDEELWFPPPDEMTDRSCMQIIRDQLKWIPQSVAWIDDSTEVPTFHCRRAHRCKRVTLGPVPTNEAGRTWLKAIEAFGIRRRNDLVRPAVVFKYEIRGSVNGKETLAYSIDKWPLSATGRERGALMQTFPLTGRVTTTISVKIETEAIDTASLAWWKARFPNLAGADVQNLAVENVQRQSAFPRMLMPGRGQLTPWMVDNSGNAIDWEEELIQATFSCDVFDTSNPTLGKIRVIKKQPLPLRIIATNAQTGTYWTTASVEEADPIPVNLARNIYEALATPQYEGRVVLVGEELNVRPGSDDPVQTPRIGVLANIAGMRDEWATMNALIQRVDEDAETGTMTCAFGPPTHLGAADLIELLQVGRRRRRWTNPATQLSGEWQQGDSAALGEATGIDGGYAGLPKEELVMVYKSSTALTLDAQTGIFKVTDGQRTLDIQLASAEWSKAPADKRTLKIKEVTVCEKINGVDTQRKCLGIFGDSYPAT